MIFHQMRKTSELVLKNLAKLCQIVNFRPLTLAKTKVKKVSEFQNYRLLGVSISAKRNKNGGFDSKSVLMSK